jgi:hypothetical protein
MGPQKIKINGYNVNHRDIEILTKRNLKIQATFYEIIDDDSEP